MPMNGDLLGQQMLAALDAAVAAHPKASDPQQRAAIWQGIGNAIVTHLQTFMVVNSIVTVASVSLVTPGVAASGPGTGTAVSPPGGVT